VYTSSFHKVTIDETAKSLLNPLEGSNIRPLQKLAPVLPIKAALMDMRFMRVTTVQRRIQDANSEKDNVNDVSSSSSSSSSEEDEEDSDNEISGAKAMAAFGLKRRQSIYSVIVQALKVSKATGSNRANNYSPSNDDSNFKAPLSTINEGRHNSRRSSKLQNVIQSHETNSNSILPLSKHESISVIDTGIKSSDADKSRNSSTGFRRKMTERIQLSKDIKGKDEESDSSQNAANHSIIRQQSTNAMKSSRRTSVSKSGSSKTTTFAPDKRKSDTKPSNHRVSVSETAPTFLLMRASSLVRSSLRRIQFPAPRSSIKTNEDDVSQVKRMCDFEGETVRIPGCHGNSVIKFEILEGEYVFKIILHLT